MLSREGFKHHLNNIESSSQWVEYYKDIPELAKVAQNSVDMSKQVLLDHFEETERLNDE